MTAILELGKYLFQLIVLVLGQYFDNKKAADAANQAYLLDQKAKEDLIVAAMTKLRMQTPGDTKTAVDEWDREDQNSPKGKKDA